MPTRRWSGGCWPRSAAASPGRADAGGDRPGQARGPVAAYHEATRLAGFDPAEAERIFGEPVTLPSPVMALLDPWPTASAQARFLARFAELGDLREHIVP